MNYILITNSDGTSSLVHADEDGAYLAHHGIKGQRWGVRRFQNPDGSLTAAGVKRIKTLESQSEKIDRKKSKLNSSKNVAKISKYTEESVNKKQIASEKKYDEAFYNHRSNSAHTEIGRGSNENKSRKAYKQFKKATKKAAKLDKRIYKFDKKNLKLDNKKYNVNLELNELLKKVDKRKDKK